MIVNDRVKATKLLMNVGAKGSFPNGLNAVQFAACAGAKNVLLAIKEEGKYDSLFKLPDDPNQSPLILAISNEVGADVIEFLAKEVYKDGRGIIGVLDGAVRQNNLELAKNLTEVWATKFDILAGKTPLMYYMEGKNNAPLGSPIKALFQDLVNHIRDLPQETKDQMPEFGAGFLREDVDINAHYPLFTINPRTNNLIEKPELVPIVHGRPLEQNPVAQSVINRANNNGIINHPQYGKSQMVHIWSDKFDYVCKVGRLDIAEAMSINPLLGRFNDSCRADHINYAVRFTNAKIVHNIAVREADTIKHVDSFGKDPLAHAVDRWCLAQDEASKSEVKNIVAEVVFHGGNDVIRAHAQIAARDSGLLDIFDDIVAHANEIHASLHPEETLVAGLAAVQLDEAA